MARSGAKETLFDKKSPFLSFWGIGDMGKFFYHSIASGIVFPLGKTPVQSKKRLGAYFGGGI